MVTQLTDNAGVILISIIVVAWFSVLVFAVALCKAAAQGDRESGTQPRAPRTAPTPAAPREAGSPVGTMSLRSLLH